MSMRPQSSLPLTCAYGGGTLASPVPPYMNKEG
jgi:hypothetical protein